MCNRTRMSHKEFDFSLKVMIMGYFETETVSHQAFFIDYPLSCNVYARLKWEQTEGRVLTMSGLGS